MEENVLNKPIDFACPKDKHPLHSIENTLHCIECNRTYPITDGIPDFLTADTQANAASVYGGTSKITTINRMARRMDFFAPIYESRWFVSTLLRLSGIRGDTSRFMEQLARFHAKTLLGITGSILDVACGPATYSRRVASPSMIFYGIDISMGMLRQGQLFIERDHIAGVHLARSCRRAPF